jgi:hypothetical protein
VAGAVVHIIDINLGGLIELAYVAGDGEVGFLCPRYAAKGSVRRLVLLNFSFIFLLVF